jgi:capsular polysaccharide transport system permease protein
VTAAAPPARAPRPGPAGAAALAGHVVVALVLRETRTRFGRQRGGYLWALAEPVVYIGGFLLLAELAERAQGRDGAMAAHFAAGVLPFMLFRDIVQRALTAVQGNRGLLMHPVVTPLDLVLARALLEAATSLVVLCLIALGILAVWGEGLPREPLALLGAMATAAAFGLALGLPVAAAANVWPVVERVVSPLLRLAFFFSGVFFAPAALPAGLREWLLWNPMLHVTEAARHAWLGLDMPAEGTLLYPLALAWLLLPFGLAAERLARARIAPA